MLFNWFRKLTGRSRPPVTEALPVPPNAPVPLPSLWSKPVLPEPEPMDFEPPLPSPAPQRRPGRPLSPAMTGAMTLLAKNPNMTAADLAEALEVSKSYAHKILRRVRERAEAEKAAARARTTAKRMPPVTAHRAKEPIKPAPAPARVQTRVPATAPQVIQAEREPAQSALFPSQRSLNLNRRARVLKLHGEGKDPHSIASELGVAPGEVEFILKIQNILVRSF